MDILISPEKGGWWVPLGVWSTKNESKSKKQHKKICINLLTLLIRTQSIVINFLGGGV